MPTRIRRTLLSAVALTCAMLGAQFVAAGPAQAITGMVWVSSSSAINSDNRKIATAWCPKGKRALGGGATTTRTPQKVFIRGLTPISDAQGDRFEARALEHGLGDSTAWRLNVHAVCVDPLPGLEIANRTYPVNDSTSPKEVKLRCPRGKQVIGWGGRVINGGGWVPTTTIRPNWTNQLLHSVTVRGEESSIGFPGNWRVRATVICSPPRHDLYLIGDIFSTPESAWTRTVTLDCPGVDKVFAVGARIASTNNLAKGDVFIDYLRIGANKLWAEVRANEGPSGFAGNWRPEAFILCAK